MSTDKVFKICMIGCGGMANQYRHKYTLIPGAKLELLIDADEEVARNAAAKTGATRWSTNWEDALAPEIDIVDVSTPNFLHELHAVTCMKAGKHVLLQKPIAPTVAEAQRIVDAAKTYGVFAGMYMSMFESPIHYEIKKMIDAGYLGEIASVHCRGAHRGGLRMAPGTWRGSEEKTGGGSFIQLTVHELDMAQWLVGHKIARVTSFSKNRL
jgi:predicted dehydrogenase